MDRDAALKTAERLLRQGKLGEAIEQYVRLVDEQPRDWNSINALGDLYVRAGDTDRAVAQYVRIADYLFNEGFLPKAAALYKKALRARTDHEHTLFRLSDVAARQGLLADAKLYLRQLVRQRTSRGDENGVAECMRRLSVLDQGDGEAKAAAARTAEGLGDLAKAAALFQEAATLYAKENRDEDALNARIAAASLSPEDGRLRTDVARALIAAGQVERAQPFLSADSIGDDVELLLAVGRNDLLAGRDAEAHATLMRVVALAPDRQGEIANLSDALIAAGRLKDAYACLEILVDAALFEAAFERAGRLLEDFAGRHTYVPALLKLVDVYVDAGFDERISAVQERLADAYLEAGQAAEARVIAEDLLCRAPTVKGHMQRLRRALEALRVADPDDVIARLQDTDPLSDNTFSGLEAGEPASADPMSADGPHDVPMSARGFGQPSVGDESWAGADAGAPSTSLNIDELLAASELLDEASSLPRVETRPGLPPFPATPPRGEQPEIDLSSVLAELEATPDDLTPGGGPLPTGDAPRTGDVSPSRNTVIEQLAHGTVAASRSRNGERR